MVNRIKEFREITIPSGFTSVRFALESHTLELKDKGLLIAGEFKDILQTPLNNDEVKSSYSKALKSQFQYVEQAELHSPMFSSRPFSLSRVAHHARFKAVEWGKGFTNERTFEKALSGIWLIFENSENRTSWIHRMEY